MSDMECKLTQRGFEYYEFTDRYGEKCSLQKSSLATEDAIWMGVDDLGLKGMRYGQGWTPISEEEVADVFGYQMVQGNKRMHLTRDQVAQLLPILQRFVDTGEIGERAGDKAMNDEERAELVHEVNKIISDNDYHIQKMDTEKASVPIVDMFARLLADRAVPEPDADLKYKIAERVEAAWFRQTGQSSRAEAVDIINMVTQQADRAVPEPAADMVHALHEALVNSAPEWIIDREDGELLEMARAALQAALAAAKGTEGSE